MDGEIGGIKQRSQYVQFGFGCRIIKKKLIIKTENLEKTNS